MSLPSDLKFTKTHEWARRSGNRVTVGITDYAQKEISDVVFVELPKMDAVVTARKPAAVVESVKAAFDIYAPVSGRVVVVNASLEKDPALINQDAYGRGFLFEIEMSQSSDWEALLTTDGYEQALKQGAH